MKNSTFASCHWQLDNYITLFNAGKMINSKVGAVENCQMWRSLWRKSFPSQRSIINFAVFQFYKSENL